jgi:hypothetical protein
MADAVASARWTRNDDDDNDGNGNNNNNNNKNNNSEQTGVPIEVTRSSGKNYSPTFL